MVDCIDKLADCLSDALIDSHHAESNSSEFGTSKKEFLEETFTCIWIETGETDVKGFQSALAVVESLIKISKVLFIIVLSLEVSLVFCNNQVL